MTPHLSERSSKVPTLWGRVAPLPPLTTVLLPQPKSDVQGAGWWKHSRNAAPALFLASPWQQFSFPPLLPLAVGTSFPFIPFNLNSLQAGNSAPQRNTTTSSPPNSSSSTCESCCKLPSSLSSVDSKSPKSILTATLQQAQKTTFLQSNLTPCTMVGDIKAGLDAPALN